MNDLLIWFCIDFSITVYCFNSKCNNWKSMFCKFAVLNQKVLKGPSLKRWQIYFSWTDNYTFWINWLVCLYRVWRLWTHMAAEKGAEESNQKYFSATGGFMSLKKWCSRRTLWMDRVRTLWTVWMWNNSLDSISICGVFIHRCEFVPTAGVLMIFYNWYMLNIVWYKFCSGITSGRVLNGEPYLCTKITEVNLSEFAYRLFH